MSWVWSENNEPYCDIAREALGEKKEEEMIFDNEKYYGAALKEIMDRLDAMQDQIDKLSEKPTNSEVISKSENTTWPKYGDEYWYICQDSSAICTYWEDRDFDEWATKIGNIFHTREEAELAVQKLKALKRLKDNGLNFQGWSSFVEGGDHFECCGIIGIHAGLIDGGTEQDRKDLDLLFGGKNEKNTNII